MTELSRYRYHPPRMPTGKDVTDLTIFGLWRRGCDTYAIALQTGIPEHQVYNRLPGIRELFRIEDRGE